MERRRGSFKALIWRYFRSLNASPPGWHSSGAVKATHPDFRYQPIAEPEELGDGGRVRWVWGRPGEAPAYAGTDFIITRDGRIAAVYLFFGKL